MSRGAKREDSLPADAAEDHEKREAFVGLRDRYEQARRLTSSNEPYENLEWILGGRVNAIQDPLGFQSKTIELIALWLQDLSRELDRRAGESSMAEAGDGMSAAARQSAERLRVATERFLAAFQPAAPV